MQFLGHQYLELVGQRIDFSTSVVIRFHALRFVRYRIVGVELVPRFFPTHAVDLSDLRVISLQIRMAERLCQFIEISHCLSLQSSGNAVAVPLRVIIPGPA